MSKRRAILLTVAVLVAVLVVWGAGCRRSGTGSSTWTLALRFIAEDPATIWKLGRVQSTATVFEEENADPSWLELWQTGEGVRELRLAEDVLVAEIRGQRPQLVRRVDFDAAEVGTLEVKLDGLSRPRLRLYWAGDGEEFSAERSLPARRRSRTERRTAWHTFTVGGHPGWQGRIRRLAFVPSAVARGQLEIGGLRGLRQTVAQEELVAAVARPWKVNLGTDVRNALLAPVGLDVRRRLTLPQRSELRFAYGLSGRLPSPVRFRVRLETASGSETLFDDELDPLTESDRPGWHDGVIDLTPWAGRAVEVVLETDGERTAELWGMPVWGHPEILRPAAGEPPVNIILISVDTLRADHLSLYGYHYPTSPRLDRWAGERAVVFETVVAPAPWTFPSHVSMFSGRDALSHGVNHKTTPVAPVPLMAELFRRAEYATLAVTGGGFLHPDLGLVRGFDRYAYWADRRHSGAEIESGVDRAAAWLEEHRTRPFFLFFHTYEVHSPYRVREPYFQQFGGVDAPSEEIHVHYRNDERVPEDGFKVRKHLVSKYLEKADGAEVEVDDAAQLLESLYDSAIAYADVHLERLLRRVDELGLAGRTVILLTSDHGEALGDKGLAGHQYLYEFNVLVPLVLALPDDRGAGRRVASQVRGVDVLPTLLEVTGLEQPPDLDGASLLELVDGDGDQGTGRDAWTYAAAGNHGVALRLGNRFKYIFDNTAWRTLGPREQLFDLRRDPAETASRPELMDRAGPVRERMLARLETIPGLRLRLRNRTAESLGGRLSGPLIAAHRVKTTGLRAATVELVDGAALGFRLEPGEETVLNIEGPTEMRGRIEVWLGEPAGGFEVGIGEDEVRSGWHLARDAGGWRPGAGPLGADATGVELWWEGPEMGTVGESPLDNREVREQLRALGYIQ